MDLSLQKNYQNLNAAIEAACVQHGRNRPQLIAVSKTYQRDSIKPILALGHGDFGENRVQEAQGKWPELKQLFPKTRLHLIGSLQSNKAKDAVALFDMIHSVDREKIARALSSEMQKQNRILPCFVQVNIGAEPQKAGIGLGEIDDFIAYMRHDCGLKVQGLMCLPPNGEDAAPYFERLAEEAKRFGLKGLSMGMSGDFEQAIAHGATHIRVGSALFGVR